MKIISVFIFGLVIGVAGFAVAQEKLQKPVRPNPTVSPSLQPLSPEAEKALGIKKTEALVAVMDVSGSIRFLYPAGWKPSDGQAQLPTDHPVNVLALDAMSVFVFSGSPTCVWVRIGGSSVKVCK